ncbi:calcium-binding protein [Sulfitobacter sp. S190]|uniref:calcium-binding protein n=1 Tax=Sulfitobacter sp. S190 TaxID=2867022 RepID=UPI0021A8E305|nr:calcium-binding protein [Sulfitobacter sp. S190]UWR23757.1 hypothetical protein K3756_07290 [Sulfitobacter sp. S190]
MLMLLSMVLPIALVGGLIANNDDDDNDGVNEQGTENDDTLSGGQGDDFVDGEGGNDILQGLAGDDTIFGRDGDDVLEGADGDDMLCSGDGDDVITGNRGGDTIEGQGGDDWVSGDYGRDNVNGNEGNDTVLGGRGTDTVSGAEGDDIVFGGIVDGVPLSVDELADLRDGATLEQASEDPLGLRDDKYSNQLSGGIGDDQLILGSGDVAEGGEGDDIFHIMSEQNGEEGFGAPTITDFNDAEDAVTLIVEDTDADLDVTVEASGDDAIIRLGDAVVGTVSGAAGTLTAGDIALVAEQDALALLNPNQAVVS